MDSKLFIVKNKDSGTELHLRVQKTATISQIMKVYSERVGIPVYSLQFRFDGNQIREGMTTNDFMIEFGNYIEVFEKPHNNKYLNKECMFFCLQKMVQKLLNLYIRVIILL